MAEEEKQDVQKQGSENGFIDMLLRSFFEEIPDSIKPSAPDTPKGRIHLAARELFANNGFNGTSTRDIAKKAEVNQAMINYYYGKKESLFRQVMFFEILGLFEDMSNIFRSYDKTRDILIHQPMALVEMISKNPIRLKIVMQIISTHTSVAGKYAGELGNSGPLGFRKRLIEIIKSAQAQHGAVDIDPKYIFFYMMSIGYGTLALLPMMREVFKHDISDPEVWENHKSNIEILIENSFFGGGDKNEE